MCGMVWLGCQRTWEDNSMNDRVREIHVTLREHGILQPGREFFLNLVMKSLIRNNRERLAKDLERVAGAYISPKCHDQVAQQTAEFC